MRAWLLACTPALLLGCSSDPDPLAGADASVSPDAGPAASCPRDPAPADRDRYVVISHPYMEGGDPDTRYKLFRLSSSGELSATETVFNLGRSNAGAIAFTPDGKVGLVAQDDGSVGAFSIDDQGAVTVIEAGYKDEFYANSIVMDPSGERAYILSRQWREHGGGIHALNIACDGAIKSEGLIVPAKLAASFHLLPGNRALIAANDAMASTDPGDAQLLSWGDEPGWLAGVSAFGDDKASIGSAAMTADQRFLLIGDNSGFSGVPNRVGVIEVDDTNSLRAMQVLTPIEDPYSIVTSPHNNAALVMSGFGDAIFVLGYDPSSTSEPFSIVGELEYQGSRPALPGAAVQLDRGSLLGRVLIAENVGIRQVQFGADGTATDLGLTIAGEGIPAIVGSLGVQP